MKRHCQAAVCRRQRGQSSVTCTCQRPKHRFGIERTVAAARQLTPAGPCPCGQCAEGCRRSLRPASAERQPGVGHPPGRRGRLPRPAIGVEPRRQRAEESVRQRMQDSTSRSGGWRRRGSNTCGATATMETERVPSAGGIPRSRCGQRLTAAFPRHLAHSLGVGLVSVPFVGVVLGAWAARCAARPMCVETKMPERSLALPQGKPGGVWAQSSVVSGCGPRHFRRIISRTIGHLTFARSPSTRGRILTSRFY